MSLLSTPTGRPERVFSLVSVVRGLGGRVSVTDAKEWLAPQYRAGDAMAPPDDTRTRSSDRVREVFRVARDLNLLDSEKDDWVSTRELPATRRQFARYVHDHLRSLPDEDPDSVLLRAYAWCAAFIEAHGAFALVSKSASDLANEIASALGRSNDGDDERSFNTTKLAAWKDWMVFLGLGWNDLPGQPGFLPDPTRRLEEEISAFVPLGSKVDAHSFISSVAKALPYLDGGVLFDEACQKGLTRPPIGQLSRLLSQAIRALEDMSMLRCEMEGDAKDGVVLFPDVVLGAKAFSYVERVSDTNV